LVFEKRKLLLRDFTSITELPNDPAIYVLIAGSGNRQFAAYVGISRHLRTRARQHFISRDSSVTVVTAPIRLNPDSFSELRWWEAIEFSTTSVLEAAEQIAFGVFDPSLRSRGSHSAESKSRLSDTQFRERVEKLLDGPPGGVVRFPTLSDTRNELAALKEEIQDLRRQVD
jgi:hypothetical protein